MYDDANKNNINNNNNDSNNNNINNDITNNNNKLVFMFLIERVSETGFFENTHINEKETTDC